MEFSLKSVAAPKLAQDQELMVEAVKVFQKNSREDRSRWNTYCDLYGNGVRDPSRHTLAFIHQFFIHQCCLPELLEASIHERSLSSALSEKDYRAILEAKARQAMRKPSVRQCFSQRFGAAKVKTVNSSALQEFLRNMEKADTRNPYASPAQFDSPWAACVKKMKSRRFEWKLQWDAYVESHGRGIRDPSRHPPEFLMNFLNQVSPPCPNRMLKEFGIGPKETQIDKVNPHSETVRTQVPNSDPESIQYTGVSFAF